MITIAGRCLRHIGGMPSNPLEVLFGSFFNLSTNDGGLQKGNGPQHQPKVDRRTGLTKTNDAPAIGLKLIGFCPKGGHGGVNQLF